MELELFATDEAFSVNLGNDEEIELFPGMTDADFEAYE